jgi:hypothetical protein
MAFDPISAIMDVGSKLIDKLIPDPKAKAEALQKLAEMQQSGDLAVIANQTEINKIEAASSNMFIAGWRPAVGWVCVSALAVQMVLGPLVVWGSEIVGHPVKLLVLDVSLLTTLLVGMLGLGGMRTVEKLQGVASK